jgi:uncharacterized protein (DUF305 family)
MFLNRTAVALIASLSASLALGVVACSDESTVEGKAAATATDRAFAVAMVPHHESAVDMARIALQRTRRPEIRQLARAIVSSQSAEIRQLEAADRRLQRQGVQEGDLAMADHEMGMGMKPATLEDARPFDREFIDEMIPHHRGAIRMARVELEQGRDPTLRRLAEAILDAQSKEIDRMNEWRAAWYGGPSPAGAAPEDGADEAPAEGGHSGHGH